MMQIYVYRIYINDALLIISDFVPEGISASQQLTDQQFDFADFYQRVKSLGPSIHVLLTKDPKKKFKSIRNAFCTIKAAGGVVTNEENRYLFIFRKGKWDLPKGKLDEGEKTEIAAVREVEEECGIKVDELGEKLCKTWHVYEERGKIIFKKTSWFSMKARKQVLVPQQEEGITEARWLAPGEFSLVKENTYPLICDVISLIEV